MRIPIIIILILSMIACILFTGCTTVDQKSDNKDALSIPDTSEEIKESQTSMTKVSETPSSTGDDEKYYFNIRIIPPSSLEEMQRELGPDEYLVRNENEELIGIVSPRSFAIRGDLVKLAQDVGREGREFDKLDIATHLVDISFGLDNAKLELFKSNKDYQFWFDAYYTNDDLLFTLNLAKYLNSLSDTTQFEDEEVARGFLKSNYEEIPYNYYNIKIIPDNMMEDFKDERKSNEHLIKDPEGNLIGIVAPDHLFLLDTLSEEDRQYYIKRGVLYSMGLHGTTYSEPDSLFIKDIGKNRDLSDLDEEAIKLLYGGKLRTGMDLEETKKTLGLTNN